MKFELTAETKEWCGIKLFRIRALIDFGNVKKGDLGGFVEKEDNLSQENNAWVSDNALVYGDALVSDNALVYGDALVSDNALVYGDAWVSGNALVSGDARVYGDALVSGNALVSGDARVYGDALVSGNARVEKTPINIIGLRYSVTITPQNIAIGCELHSHEEWENFDDREILEMDGKDATVFWKEHKDMIIKLAKGHSEQCQN